MGVPYTQEQLKKLNLIEVNGTYVKASDQAAKGKVSKLKPLDVTHLDEGVGKVYPASLTGIEPEVIVPHEFMKKFIEDGFSKINGNKKIRNATKSTNGDGVKFDSNLERYMYDLLKGAAIDFEFQKVFILQPKFGYRTEAIRAITKVVDFYITSRDMIIDTKGFSNDVSPLKHKMLKFVLMKNYNMEPEIVMPSTKKECELLLNRLKFEP